MSYSHSHSPQLLGAAPGELQSFTQLLGAVSVGGLQTFTRLLGAAPGELQSFTQLLGAAPGELQSFTQPQNLNHHLRHLGMFSSHFVFITEDFHQS